MQTFVDKYPELFSQCEAVYDKLVHNGFPQKEEISFDLILPFLLPIPEKTIQHKIAYELVIYREIIDDYNKGNYSKLWEDLFSRSAGYYPISIQDYSYFNQKREIIDNNIIKSYECSVDRVFYRFSVLLNYRNHIANDFNTIMCDVKKASAFLLFDDDMCDLEEDIERGKKTILVSFLEFHKNIIIEDMINMFEDYMKSIKIEKLYKFIRPILNIYK
ncbi:hypothetical protein FACS189440_04170 [Bacteroidia bacterium]|nr:hypothetical protein FACS189423_02980 [Bacteroidia bacterium]GHT46352.1 hypothetical protein FACS189440_04170 [Bacteroidia bacterium]